MGSFLHINKDRTNKQPTVVKLQGFISELEEVASSTSTAAG